MKLNSKRDKRNYIIIALCMILVVMGVGYAAFSSLLTINGMANISNSWCVGFDSNLTSAYEITKGVSTGTAPTGSMSFSGDACESNYKPNSSLTAHFYQPGDQIEYTLTIVNKSTVTAAIKSFTINGEENITSNWTHTDGNITYKVNMPADTTLSPNESTTMTVIAKFQNETDVTGNVNGETKTLSVSIDVQQDDGNGGFAVSETNAEIVYRNSFDELSIGESIENISTSNSSPSSAEGSIYIKHQVVNNIITASYVCFVSDTEHCLQGGDSSYYLTNKQILQSQDTWFRNFTGTGCWSEEPMICGGSGSIEAQLTQNIVQIYVPDSFGCYISNSNSYCTEATG